MSIIFDLETAPVCETTASLGHTENYRIIAWIEAEVYIAALQALFGPAPQGVTFSVHSNPHDFGVYPSVQITVTDAALANTATATYLEEIEGGFEHWHEAGFSAPAIYDGNQAVSYRSASDTIYGALQSTRPAADGRFPYPEAEMLHSNLRKAYVNLADRFDAWVAESKENADG